MLLSRITNLDDKIVETLLKSPLQIKSLKKDLLREVPKLSLRAVYKAVNRLIDAGVLIKVGKVVGLDEEWIQLIKNRVISAPIELASGERMAYSFNSYAHLDSYWKTVVFQLEKYESDGHIFLYNPHN